ncbi:MATE family efflux transporter [Pseudoflavonifractor sp. DSM 107456]|uniref:Probable multidrug resistance protein NorM n=2 Tax=Pseudoflavonifractor TaxID=1017280 RepID=A0ABR9RAH4_9FIRM|nr:MULTISPECIES: MATE family efflux transporter [Pseudoflavonifractor]MBC5730529.1 MATE family efflux transporter [Pseudoflavonifractor hominis]MBE5055682.1 MATE family efflux transporter [Pseudoflavonifractor gallinarum]MBS5133866.1 MATE family efflux transporter [Oscillospiraceae bacterium]MBT9684312.1 MATE family efflux transporter [Pseudoflavonifractor sp. MCC625]
MSGDLTRGPITATMLLFALPMMLGNLLQQCYNVADTLIVGRFLGASALAAVGSSYTLMTFLTSILLGLCMGSGAVFSICHGAGDKDRLQRSLAASFLLIGGVTLVLNLAVFLLLDPILTLLQVPPDTRPLMREYLWVIFWGIAATFLYNYFASLLRAVGNSLVPLLFLAVCALLNIALDLVFVLVFHWGVAGAAGATVLSQYVSGLGIGLYTWVRCPQFRPDRSSFRIRMEQLREIAQFSFLTSLQQSVMNFGILMVQGLINSFGTTVMAAFAAAVKIDSFAYMPVQDFGNAFSTFVAQNYGARKAGRIRSGIRSAVAAALLFCVVISAAVCLFARPLMLLFVQPEEVEILAIGVQYLRVEGAFYCGIGCLFLLYGLYRAVGRPGMSLVLTVISLGTRVLLAYTLSAIPAVGVLGIWWSVPIGWLLADLAGFLYYRRRRAVLFAGLEESAV